MGRYWSACHQAVGIFASTSQLVGFGALVVLLIGAKKPIHQKMPAGILATIIYAGVNSVYPGVGNAQVQV